VHDVHPFYFEQTLQMFEIDPSVPLDQMAVPDLQEVVRV
jgi:hypothetical protein